MLSKINSVLFTLFASGQINTVTTNSFHVFKAEKANQAANYC